ncbi:MAG: ATP-binding cassette domain-containing protein [Dongiaceae bacterium]
MIRVEGLIFDYPGLRALDDVSFRVEPQTITALVGPNGAGKTTLMRCMAALDRPYAGRVEIDDMDVHESPRDAHRMMGFLPDFFGLYDELTVDQCLRYRAAALDVPSAECARRAGMAAERVFLADRRNNKAGSLSRGLRQRLAIAQAIIQDPKVCLLDEPAAGLDPEARIELAQLLLKLRDDGMTLIVSSHILSELEDYSSHMMIMNKGRIVEHRPVGGGVVPGDTIDMIVTFLELPPQALQRLAAIPGIGNVRAEGLEVRFSASGDARQRHEVLRQLIEAGLQVSEFREDRQGLQSAYLARMKGAAQ